MPEYEISFRAIAGAVKHHWKLLLLTLVLFSAVGAGAGYFYADRGSVEAAGAADALESAEILARSDEMDYYSKYYSALELDQKNAQTYLDAFSGLSDLSEEDCAALEDLEKQLSRFSKDELKPILDRLDVVDAIYVPENCIPDLIEKYRNALASTQRELIAAEAAAKLLATMDAPVLEDEGIRSSYGALLNRAYNYTTYLRDQEKYTQMLERLETDTASILADSRELYQMEVQAGKQLSRLMEQISEMADDLAQRMYLNISGTYDTGGVLTVDIVHTHTAVSAQENFQIIWLFCTLSGVCVGAFLALCREAGAFSRRKRK